MHNCTIVQSLQMQLFRDSSHFWCELLLEPREKLRLLCSPDAPVYEEPFERERSLEEGEGLASAIQCKVKQHDRRGQCRGQCEQVQCEQVCGVNKCDVNKGDVKRIFTRERNVSR